MAYYEKLEFEWDPEKDRANRRKHRLSFEEASVVFRDFERTLTVADDDHSAFEARYLSIGRIARGVVVVSWTERDEDRIRIISARFATRAELRSYAEAREGFR